MAALFTDIRFAAEHARFTTAFSRRELVADDGVTWLWPKLVGVNQAMDLLLSARAFDGVEAARMGLVDRTLAGDEVLDTALAYAHTLAAEYSPSAMAEIKQRIYTALDSGVPAANASQRMGTSLRRPAAPAVALGVTPSESVRFRPPEN